MHSENNTHLAHLLDCDSEEGEKARILAWVMVVIFPIGVPLVLLILSGLFGGVGQIMMTESYRFADASTIAPFDYSSIIFGILISLFVFGEIPTLNTIAGSVFVVGAGIFIIFREHRLGLERRKIRRVSSSQNPS